MRILNPLLLLFLSLSIALDAYCEPSLVKTIDFGDSGGRVVRFGDLTGDGKAEIVTAQNVGQRITCVTAFDYSGKMLWQRGTPDPNNHITPFDLAVQVYDFNSNGRSEVIFVERAARLTVLDGATGKVIQSTRIRPGSVAPRDAIFIAPLIRKDKPAIVVKNRYRQFWVFDHRLRQVYTRQLSVGHFPASYKTKRGTHRLLIGYSAFDFGRRKAREVWRIKRDLDPYKWHNDAVSIGSIGGNGRLQAAIATSKDSILVNPRTGRVLWSQPTRSAQHANISKTMANFIDRGARGRLTSYNRAGELVHDRGQHGRLAMLSVVNGWDSSGDYLLVFRRAEEGILLISEDNQRTVELTFPRLPHFAQHFDIQGDAKEEILIYDHRELFIYENLADDTVTIDNRLPQARIYNASFYSGH